MIYTDLTMSYSDEIPGFGISPARNIIEDGWNATTLQIYSHSGTHMDAPKHFDVGSKTIDQFEIREFISDRAWVIDLSTVNESHLITLSDVKDQLLHFQKGDSILLRTDWYKRFGTDVYRNKLPRLSRDLAQWMATNEVGMLGVEPPSVADVNNIEEVTIIHTILLPSVIIIEGLCNLDRLKSKMVTFIALPLKIKGGDGAPCRAIVIEKDKE